MDDIKRMELSEEDICDVTGGTLIWGSDKTVQIKGSDSGVYYFSSYRKCSEFMNKSCRGLTDQQTLDALEEAGYIHK